MFDITNKELIKSIINHKSNDKFTIPVCIKIFNQYYDLLSLSEIDKDVNYSNFKVIFGIKSNLLGNFNVPKSFFLNYDITKYSDEDPDTGVVISYIIFEVSNLDVSDYINETAFESELREYYTMLYNHISVIANENKKKRINQFVQEQYDE